MGQGVEAKAEDGPGVALEGLGEAIAELTEQLEGLRAWVVDLAERQERVARLVEDITGEDLAPGRRP